MDTPKPIPPIVEIDPAGDRFINSTVRPPFTFQGVTSRAFPLRANVARLTQFCDNYLNMDIPKEIVYFRPALPFVYLIVLNYGSMAPASVQARNFGWVAQNEVTFLVLLERWHLDKQKDKLVFDDWVNVSPFIFVDSQLSLTTGREVYGWPKVLANVEADIPLWSTHPRLPVRLFSLSVPMFRDVFAGEAEEQRVLIQIDFNPLPTFAQLPPDLSNPFLPFTAIPRAVRNSLSLTGDVADWLLGLRVRGITANRDLASLLAMSKRAASYIGRLLPEILRPSSKQPAALSAVETPADEKGSVAPVPRIFNDSVTLKQFRDPESPHLACYKALVTSRIGIERVNRCGLLGDLSLLGGDASCGFTIRINQYTAQPIIESLGIEVDVEERGRDGRATAAILKPVLPFWTDVDLFYDKGHVICSRTNFGGEAQTSWIEHPTVQAKVSHPFYNTTHGSAEAKVSDLSHNTAQGTAEAQVSDLSRSTAQGAAEAKVSDLFYNTAQGAATQAVVGPFLFPDVTVQVYPLMADQAKLDAFLKQYLNDPLCGSRLQFTTFGSYVYLIVTVYGAQGGVMSSGNNNIGWWADREVAFCVPVKWYDEEQLISTAMVEPFVYANKERAVITDREVNGRASVYATIDSQNDVWLSPEGPVADRRLLHMEIDSFPALGLGQQAQPSKLLEIDGCDVLPKNGEVEENKVERRMISETWGRELLADLNRKVRLSAVQKNEANAAKALALEVLAHGAPINRITLKQYRDAFEVEKACYQSLVHTPRSITRVYDIREIVVPHTHVRLHRISGCPIAQVLGLKIKKVDSVGGHVVDVIQPIRPFWMHLAIEERLGRVIGTVESVEKQRIKGEQGVYLHERDFVDHRPVDRPTPCERNRNWMSAHYWFLPRDMKRSEPVASNANRTQPVSGEVDAPYFCAPGDTRVPSAILESRQALDQETQRSGGEDLVMGISRLQLNRQANDWLRKSLTYELASIRSALESDGSQLQELAEFLKPSGFDPFVHSPSVCEYCAASSVESLMALAAKLAVQRSSFVDKVKSDARVEAESSEAYPRTTRSGRRADVLTALKNLKVSLNKTANTINNVSEEWSSSELLTLKTLIQGAILGIDRSIEILGPFSDQKRKGVELSMSIKVGDLSKEIDTLMKTIRLRMERRVGHLVSDLIKQATNIINIVSDWEDIRRFYRLKRKDAAHSIAKLEELQVVLESILSDGWLSSSEGWKMWDREEEERKESPLSKQSEPWPRHRFPVGSVTDEWAEHQGLRREYYDHRFGESWIIPNS
jgi:hypothetical protein